MTHPLHDIALPNDRSRMIPAVDFTPFVRPPSTGVVYDTTAVLMEERYGEGTR